MLANQIRDGVSLNIWLEDKPRDWAQAIALRVALRVLPYSLTADDLRIQNYFICSIRAAVAAWRAINYADRFSFASSKIAGAVARSIFDKNAKQRDIKAANLAIFVCSRAANASSDRPRAIIAAVEVAKATFQMISGIGNDSEPYWSEIRNDCAWLVDGGQESGLAKRLSRLPIWHSTPPLEWSEIKLNGFKQLLEWTAGYAIWTEWYDRRVDGKKTAFDIPGDSKRLEDKELLARIGDQSDAGFWGLGYRHVNASVQGWLDEARARVAPPIPEVEADIRVPSQEPHAIAYGVNNDGMIDRLPSSNQKHLRDSPEQHRGYVDIREAADTLFDENQRLGPRLYAAIERFRASLPESFEEAETYLVWRDGNALRRLYLAHRKVEARNEPDEARLEAVVAEMLGGLLDLYNVFAFADDGLRAKDEDRITLQERADGKAEASASAPIMRAIFDNPAITSDAVRQDIQVEVENSDLPVGDPYSDQALDQSNRINRNLVAGILQWISENLGNPTTFPGAVAVTVTSGAVAAGGSALLGAASGINFFPLLEFVAAQASDLHSYVSIAYPSYPHLTELIAQAKHLWQRITGKV